MKQKHLIFALIATLLIVILVIQNTTPVELKIYFWQVNKPLILLIVIVALMGAVASWFFSLSSLKQARWEHEEALRKINELEKKLAAKPDPAPTHEDYK